MKGWETGLLVMAVLFLAIGGSDLVYWWHSGRTYNLVMAVLFSAGSVLWVWRARPNRKTE